MERLSSAAELAGKDLVIVLTDHSDVDYTELASLGGRVFDACNIVLPSENVTVLCRRPDRRGLPSR